MPIRRPSACRETRIAPLQFGSSLQPSRSKAEMSSPAVVPFIWSHTFEEKAIAPRTVEHGRGRVNDEEPGVRSGQDRSGMLPYVSPSIRSSSPLLRPPDQELP